MGARSPGYEIKEKEHRYGKAHMFDKSIDISKYSILHYCYLLGGTDCFEMPSSTQSQEHRGIKIKRRNIDE